MESSDSFDMISGTNGLLGATDGAFIMQKEKQTENKAVLEVAGRDQQDQRLFLNFNREQCAWELTKSETELWKEPVDSVLELLATVVTDEAPEWIGFASELLQLAVGTLEMLIRRIFDMVSARETESNTPKPSMEKKLEKKALEKPKQSEQASKTSRGL